MRLELQEKLDCDLADRKKEVDELVMEVIDEQTQDDEEEEESESEEETPPKKRKAVAKKKSADSEESGSEYSPPGEREREEHDHHIYLIHLQVLMMMTRTLLPVMEAAVTMSQMSQSGLDEETRAERKCREETVMVTAVEKSGARRKVSNEMSDEQ